MFEIQSDLIENIILLSESSEFGAITFESYFYLKSGRAGIGYPAPRFLETIKIETRKKPADK